MEVEEFRRILSAGLGRAILYVRDHDATPYREIILRACTHGMVYDHQVEGSRAEWLFELIQLTDDLLWYREGILAALAATTDTSEYHDRHLFEIARLFAEHGDDDARRVMYATFARKAAAPDKDRSDLEGALELLNLDGIDAFEFILRHLDMRLLIEEESWAPDYLFRDLESKIGKEEAALALERLAREDASAAAFRGALLKDREQRPRWTPEKLTYEQVKALVADPKGTRKPSRLRQWGKTASESDLVQAATDFLNEDDLELLYGYVLIFQKRAFPLAPDKLISLAKSLPDARMDYRDADIHYKVALRAWNTLEHVGHPLVRLLALESLHLAHWADRAVRALKHNYNVGDHLLIGECYLRQESEWYLHDVGHSALLVFEANPTPENGEVLPALYESVPCSICRDRCIEQLIALRQLPAWMAAECRFDANDGIRARVAEYLAAGDAAT